MAAASHTRPPGVNTIMTSTRIQQNRLYKLQHPLRHPHLLHCTLITDGTDCSPLSSTSPHPQPRRQRRLWEECMCGGAGGQGMTLLQQLLLPKSPTRWGVRPQAWSQAAVCCSQRRCKEAKG
jgi:hypothetical protein